MLKKYLKPVCKTNLVRFGNNKDGGYLIPEEVVKKTDYLISFGVGYDWSFEEDFKRAKKNLRVFCYDHTVDRRFWYKYTIIAFFDLIKSFRQRKKILKFLDYKNFFNNLDIFHYKKQVVENVRVKTKQISLISLSKKYKKKNIFFKIDIDNDEWRILYQIKYFDKLLGLVLELHNIDLQSRLLKSFLSKNKKFKIAHIHANNMGGIDKNGDPLIIELTLLNTKLAKKYKIIKNKKFKPHLLDFKNDPCRDEIAIKF